MLKSTLLSILFLVSSTLARPTPEDEAVAALALRAVEIAGREGKDVGVVARQLFGDDDDEAYRPFQMPCPTEWTWVRSADVSIKLTRAARLTVTDHGKSLGQGEMNYLDQRRPVVDQAVQTMMQSQGLPTPPRTPVISFALSGGGLRAMTCVEDCSYGEKLGEENMKLTPQQSRGGCRSGHHERVVGSCSKRHGWMAGCRDVHGRTEWRELGHGDFHREQWPTSL